MKADYILMIKPKCIKNVTGVGKVLLHAGFWRIDGNRESVASEKIFLIEKKMREDIGIRLYRANYMLN